MLVIQNDLIPFKGFKAMTMYPFIFVHGEVNDVCLRHEAIHARQQKELLFVPFFILYIAEWLVRLALLRSWHDAYMAISFEREAYARQNETGYKRKPFAMWR